MQEKEAADGGGEVGTEVKERTCPKCQAAMVSRKSKFGPFYGCANYPKCKHTEKG